METPSCQNFVLRLKLFTDCFKSELMETLLSDFLHFLHHFTDCFKSELMETGDLSISTVIVPILFTDCFKSELMETFCLSGITCQPFHFTDCFKSELMETIERRFLLLGLKALPIALNRN